MSQLAVPSEQRSPRRSPLRLMLREPDAHPGPIDGAWWPHTADPATEMHHVIVAVTPRLGQLVQIAFDWKAAGYAPDNVAPDNDEAPLAPPRDSRARIMHLFGLHGSQLAILVIPAAADPASAASHMRWAAGRPFRLDPHLQKPTTTRTPYQDV